MHRSLNPDVLLCGFRRGLAKALEAEGLNYIVLEKRPFSYKSPYLLETFLAPDGFSSTLKNIREQYKQGSVRAVIASKEWAVLPAAELRRSFGLSGNSVEVAETCTDKFRMKERAKACNIPITDFATAHSNRELEQLKQKWGLPVVAKLLRGSGSRGLLFIEREQSISMKENWHELIFEKYIEGKEVSIESFLIDGQTFFCNLTQYYEKAHINILPFQQDFPEFSALQALNQNVIQAMGIKNGMTHAEYYLTKKGFLLGEIAVRPPGGYIMDALKLAYGFDAWQALLRAELADVQGLKKTISQGIKQFVAVNVIHPGAGQVRSIRGYQDLIENKLAFKVKLKLEVGQTLGVRQGMGSDFGTVIQVAPTYRDLLKNVGEMQKKCQISLDADEL